MLATAVTMTPRFALLRALLRPSLQPVNHCLASNSSHTSPPPASVDDSVKADLIKCLVDQGIPSEESEEIVSHLPNHRVDPEDVYRTLNSLNALQFGRDRLTQLLKTHPALVLTSADRISKCYTNLSSIFSQNYVYKILFNSPNVIDQRRSVVADKINYLNKTLAIPNSHIVNSSVLSYPLTHIKVRSEFLMRCGILKKPSKKDQVMTVVDLSDMFDTDDVLFATKVAKLTPVEYEAFTTLFSREEDSDSESCSDSE